MTTSTLLTSTDEELEEQDILIAIPILPGGMVDIALHEMGATLVEVCRIEDKQAHIELDVD